MKRHMTRIILLVALVISLCMITTLPANAAGGQKQKAHGAGKAYVDFSQFGWSCEGESHINFTFEAPGKGYYEYRDISGPWAGSWARWEIKGLDFGSYTGSRPEIIPDSAVVYFWGQCTAGESYTDLDYPGIPPDVLLFLVPYSNIEGYYKVGAFIDGGPGHENDGGLLTVEIPPEGNPMLSFLYSGIPAGDGEAQAQWLFNAVANGEIEFGYGKLVTGNVNIK